MVMFVFISALTFNLFNSICIFVNWNIHLKMSMHVLNSAVRTPAVSTINGDQNSICVVSSVYVCDGCESDSSWMRGLNGRWTKSVLVLCVCLCVGERLNNFTVSPKWHFLASCFLDCFHSLSKRNKFQSLLPRQRGLTWTLISRLTS